jgi:hypothetical protein
VNKLEQIVGKRLAVHTQTIQQCMHKFLLMHRASDLSLNAMHQYHFVVGVQKVAHWRKHLYAPANVLPGNEAR